MVDPCVKCKSRGNPDFCERCIIGNPCRDCVHYSFSDHKCIQADNLKKGLKGGKDGNCC